MLRSQGIAGVHYDSPAPPHRSIPRFRQHHLECLNSILWSEYQNVGPGELGKEKNVLSQFHATAYINYQTFCSIKSLPNLSDLFMLNQLAPLKIDTPDISFELLVPKGPHRIDSAPSNGLIMNLWYKVYTSKKWHPGQIQYIQFFIHNHIYTPMLFHGHRGNQMRSLMPVQQYMVKNMGQIITDNESTIQTNTREPYSYLTEYTTLCPRITYIKTHHRHKSIYSFAS